MTVWRAAIYAAPGYGSPDTTSAHALTLRERAEEWLGRPLDGREIRRAAPHGWSRAEVDEITTTARSYGFHATLKAPFRLAPGRSLDDVDGAVADLAAHLPAVSVPRLRLSTLGSFFALVPDADDRSLQRLQTLAGTIVTDLDAHRAPLTDAERARRNPAGLTPRQRELLERWGYPYVLDEFRFHFTVTDRIPADRRGVVEATLRTWFDGVLGQDIPLDVLAVLTQPAPDEPFGLHSVHPLASAAAPAAAEPFTATHPTDVRTPEGIPR